MDASFPDRQPLTRCTVHPEVPAIVGQRPWATALAAARTPKIFFGSFPRDTTRSLALSRVCVSERRS